MINVRIISAKSSLYDGQAEAVFFPSALGEFEVLPHHADLLSTLTSGTIRIRESVDNTKQLQIHSGIVRVQNGEITACVEL